MKPFFGTKNHSVDEKNRIRIPSCFKDNLGSNIVFVRGVYKGNKVIDIYPREVIDKRLEKLYDRLEEGFCDNSLQDFITKYSRTIREIAEDSQGRIIIPEDLVKYANIGKEVVTIGAVNHLVMMNAELDEVDELEEYNSTMEYFKNNVFPKKEQ